MTTLLTTEEVKQLALKEGAELVGVAEVNTSQYRCHLVPHKGCSRGLNR